MSDVVRGMGQFDLFGLEAMAEPRLEDPKRSLREEEMICHLTGTGRYRVLKRLVPRPVTPTARAAFPLRGLIVDAETTGLSHRQDKVIEIALVSFTFDEAGRVGDVLGVYTGLQDPGIRLPPDIVRLTGITDEMLAGQFIDIEAVAMLVEPADLVIAHNAGFDRPFCEALCDAFAGKEWACSVSEIGWSARGFEGTKLAYLVGQAGLFHEGHRAVDDCFALLEVLASQHPADPSPLAELYAASRRSRVRIFAEHSPFDMKDCLKARGYRWSDGSDGRPKCWWIELDEDALDDELVFLRREIYRWEEADPPVRRLTALDRFRG